MLKVLQIIIEKKKEAAGSRIRNKLGLTDQKTGSAKFN